MQLNLSEVDESISEKMFFSLLLKVLPLEFEIFFTLVKYGQDKTLDEIKRDLINFENEKRKVKNTEKSESVSFANDRTCFIVTKGAHFNICFRYCRNQGIRFENSAPYTPQENGKIGRI